MIETSGRGRLQFFSIQHIRFDVVGKAILPRVARVAADVQSLLELCAGGQA